MTIHLLKTSEFSDTLYEEIISFLSVYKLPICFVKATNTLVLTLSRDYDFEEAYTHCNNFRKVANISSTDKVVLLTTMPQYDGWFSKYDQLGNICIIAHKLKIGEKTIPEKLFFVYQIAYNTLQSEMKIDFDNDEHRANVIHMHPVGCVNDYCGKFEDIKLKFLTGYICDKCKQYAVSQGMSTAVIAQIADIGNKTRNQIEIAHTIAIKDIPPIILTVKRNDFNFKIGEVLLNLSLAPLLKSLYAYLIIYPEGIRTFDFCVFNIRFNVDATQQEDILLDDYLSSSGQTNIKPKALKNKAKEIRRLKMDFEKYLSLRYNLQSKLGKFYAIYSKIANDHDAVNLRDTIYQLGQGDHLSKRISEINLEIKNKLGEPYASYHKVSYVNDVYKVLNAQSDKFTEDDGQSNYYTLKITEPKIY